MNLLKFFQILDVWTPSPVEEPSFLLEGLLIYASPIIIIIVIAIIVKKRKKNKHKYTIALLEKKYTITIII